MTNSMTPEEVEYIVMAYLKIGDYQTPKQLFERFPKYIEQLGTWYRLLVLIDASDRDAARTIIERWTHPDPQRRALFLQLRAWLFLQQGLNEEASILIQDSLILDGLAP